MTTLQKIYQDHDFNLFDAASLGVDISSIMYGSISLYRQQMISAMSVPVYPVVVDETRFWALMRAGVEEHKTELHAWLQAVDGIIESTEHDTPQHTVKRVYGARSSTREYGSVTSEDEVGEVAETTTIGSRSTTTTVGQRQRTDNYGAESETATEQARSDQAVKRNTFDDLNNGLTDPLETVDTHYDGRSTATNKAARSDTHADAQAIDIQQQAAAQDGRTTGAHTITRSTGAHTDTDDSESYTDEEQHPSVTDTVTRKGNKAFSARQQADADAAQYAILRNVIIEAVAGSRGRCYGAV